METSGITFRALAVHQAAVEICTTLIAFLRHPLGTPECSIRLGTGMLVVGNTCRFAPSNPTTTVQAIIQTIIWHLVASGWVGFATPHTSGLLTRPCWQYLHGRIAKECSGYASVMFCSAIASDNTTIKPCLAIITSSWHNLWAIYSLVTTFQLFLVSCASGFSPIFHPDTLEEALVVLPAWRIIARFGVWGTTPLRI